MAVCHTKKDPKSISLSAQETATKQDCQVAGTPKTSNVDAQPMQFKMVI